MRPIASRDCSDWGTVGYTNSGCARTAGRDGTAFAEQPATNATRHAVGKMVQALRRIGKLPRLDVQEPIDVTPGHVRFNHDPPPSRHVADHSGRAIQPPYLT